MENKRDTNGNKIENMHQILSKHTLSKYKNDKITETVEKNSISVLVSHLLLIKSLIYVIILLHPKTSLSV